MTTRTSYDPHQLVRDVEALLRARGVDAELPPGYFGEALGAAGTLLRVLGVTPAIDAIEAFERSAAKPWSEREPLPPENDCWRGDPSQPA